MPPPTQLKSTKTARGIIPFFPSTSIWATVAFYKDKLHWVGGSTYNHDDGPEPTFCSLFIGAKAQANIYFFTNSDPGDDDVIGRPAAAMIAMGSKALDDYYETLKSEAQVEFKEHIADKEWGYRQFTVKDGDGNRLTFFRFLEGTNGEEEKDGEVAKEDEKLENQ